MKWLSISSGLAVFALMSCGGVSSNGGGAGGGNGAEDGGVAEIGSTGGGLACREAVMSGTFQVPAHAGYTHWRMNTAGLSLFEFDVQIHNDPGTSVGLYFSPLNSFIDGAQFYLGLQTNVQKPKIGGIGKGIIFSSWGTFDAADVRLAPGGFMELGTHEGMFAGARLDYPWGVGHYRLRLNRAEAERGGDWFDLFITDMGTGIRTFVGGIRFARRDSATPAVIQPATMCTTFVEIYLGATTYSAVPAWHLSLQARGDGAPAVGALSEYPAFPYAEYPNVDIYREAGSSEVHMIYGGATRRCHGPGTLF